MSQFSLIYCNQTTSTDMRVHIKKNNHITRKLWNLKLSLWLHAVTFSGSLSHTVTYDRSRRPHCSRHGLSLPLFQRKCEYGTLWITPHIWMLVDLICTISLHMRVKLCVCVGEWGNMMECLMVLLLCGFPEDASSPTVCTSCSWLFYLRSGTGRLNPWICTVHITAISWQRNSYGRQSVSHK
jgi:hypothetical protein